MTGFINVNKAQGVSSAQEVNIIKRLFNCPCGHMGTLDPMASGVLPVAIGNAARLFDYFLDKHKKYLATFMFGCDSDTLDTTGKVIDTGDKVPTEDEINGVLDSFCGEILQIPPRYSAKNINGVRGYQLARRGVDFSLPPKKVTIYSIKLIRKASFNSYEFEVECGGGTYIRSIARDLGEKLSTHSIMSALVRTKSGIFDIGQSVQTSLLTVENCNEYIIPTDSVLPLESIYTDALMAKRLFNGLTTDCDKADGLYKIYMPDRSFYGLAEVKHKILKVRTKLC